MEKQVSKGVLKKRVGVVVNVNKGGAKELLDEIERVVVECGEGVEVLLEERTAAFVGGRGVKITEICHQADVLLVAGGDGSLLRVVHRVFPHQIPILGIHMGSLGFLTGARREDLKKAIVAIESQSFYCSPRMVLEATIRMEGRQEKIPCALNDIVITRAPQGQMIRMGVKVNDKVMTEYMADGLIVATPTGSTAYSLAAGGPIVSPDAGVIIVTPLSPHTLSNRSVVLGGDAIVTVEITGGRPPAYIEYDGCSLGEWYAGAILEIKASAHKVSLAYIPGNDFFHLLRSKLAWKGMNIS